jgi:ABC transporter DrrB family efflux protein
VSTLEARAAPSRPGLSKSLSDTMIVTGRNLRRVVRNPQVLVFSTIQPVMLVLLFNYVFGGAIGASLHAPGIPYVDYLLPGVMIQAIAFGTTTTAVGMSEDLSSGVIDRFRSLPMARSAVLAGRAIADTLRIAFVIVLMTGVGFIIGFRFTVGPARVIEAFAVAVAFGLSFSWIAVWIGMLVSQPEAAQSAGFIWLFPLIFASSVFVPTDTFPSALQAFASWNPLTHFVDALRTITLEVGGGTRVVPTARPVLTALAWAVGILVVFAPLAVLRYRRAS